ncbi:MAG: MFS transporter [Candidatus Syntrophonatronum acetioxidans]|uniref:MFS transporter n=1 Tax=Candidatus Syntrophonatronum acetioxidans TaxID=1795816 RepID=A0A424YET1_9FIRM|nr:MAG: MFS transporter [Candidatus Syntrophonatronum acetioxidans]
MEGNNNPGTPPEKVSIIESKTFNLALLFGAALIVFINFSSSLTVLPLYVLEIGESEFMSGLQNTLFFLSAILLRTYFGPMADIRGRKLPLLIGVTAFATAPLLFYLSSNIWMLILARVYQAIGLAAFFSSSTSLVADLAPREKTGAFMSSYRILMSLALLIGPAASLSLINAFDYTAWFWCCFLAGIPGIILIILLKTPSNITKDGIGSWERFKTLLTNQRLPLILQGVVLVSICIGALLSYAIIHVSQATQASNPAIYFTYYALAGIMANLFVGRLSDRVGRKTIFWPMVMTLGIGLLLLFFLPQAGGIYITSGLLAGVGAASGISVGFAWVIDVVEENMRATALALMESTIDISVALGSFIFGAVGSWIGLGNTFGFTGLAILIGGFSFFILSSRKLPAP